MQESRKKHRVRTKGKPVSVEGMQGECYQWKATGQCTKGDACSFRHDENKCGTLTRSSSPAPKPQTKKAMEKFLRQKMSLRGRSPSGKSKTVQRQHQWELDESLV